MSPNYGYSITGLDPEKTAKASGRDIRCSPKACREVCNFIKGKKLEDAKEYLFQVIELKKAIPFKRHNKHVAHRKGLDKWSAGKFPRKVANEIMTVLEAAEANAEYKGLDIDKTIIKHAAVSRGPIIKKNIPRAFSRSSPYYKLLTHIEIVLEEK
ncbi:MAG: 50S ribosomal protein L22 [Candidatus Lokiarchaeota archaeon]|nr:50S ribosomal protein L22 [Candidatus Lokiarchaeota archaeon]